MKQSTDFETLSPHKHQDLHYRIVGKKDAAAIWELFKTSYIPDEPTYQYFGITADECESYFKSKIEKTVIEGNSHGAFDQDGVLRGVMLVHDSPNYKELYQNFLKSDISRRVKIEDNPFWELLLRFHRKYGETTKFITLGPGCVHPAYRARGILISLINRIYDRAKQKNCDLMMAIASGEYSYRSFLKTGAQVDDAIEYSTYVDPITRKKEYSHIKPPHTHARLVVIRVDKEARL